MEFKVGDTVTIDRYNPKGQEEKMTVLGYGEMLGGDLTYKCGINDVVLCDTTGKSIMESVLYEPVPDEERHTDPKHDGKWYQGS